TGEYELIGKVGEVRSDLQPNGEITVNGEWWKATSDETIERGAHVEVLGMKGLTLLVRRH
ncbi:MAG: NfeD family protein, partial [Chloroflexi bacterium]|nr:NfeD family protein [Chloroflexota bacterium]